MSFFSDTVASRLSGATVQAALLVFFDFVGEPMRLWAGFGSILTTDGNTWAGLDGLGQIDGLQQAIGTVAPKATFTISATDPSILILAQGQSTLVKNRGVTVFLQFFDATWAPLDSPYALWTGLMDTMAYSSDGPSRVYKVSVSAESLWTGRNRAPFGFYDTEDQIARGFRNDLGLVQVPALAGKTIRWPTT